MVRVLTISASSMIILVALAIYYLYANAGRDENFYFDWGYKTACYDFKLTEGKCKNTWFKQE